MDWDESRILGVWDECCESCSFPMLDNGYVYLAATRLSLFRSARDWALVIEVFGFSPRAGFPDISIQTFASRLHQRDTPEKYVSTDAYQNYLKQNPHNEFRTVFPIEEGDWMDAEENEMVARKGELRLRNRAVPLPSGQEYLEAGIVLENERPAVFELSRYLAARWREEVLATATEQRVSVLPEMAKLLQLEEWHHPDTAQDEVPSLNQTFQQLAKVLVTGDVASYRPSQKPNTHWSNWPEGGTL